MKNEVRGKKMLQCMQYRAQEDEERRNVQRMKA